MHNERDASGRLSIDLSDDPAAFRRFSVWLESRYGPPISRVSGLDQDYWDFDIDGTLVVLHADAMAGVSIHVEDGSHDDLLRELAGELTRHDS